MKLTIKQLGAVGLAKDPLPYDLPPNGWSDAGNVRCEDGRVSSFPGHEEYTTPTVTPYWLQGFSSGTAYYWLYAGLDKVNPAGLILSAVEMLRYMGWREAAELIIDALRSAILAKRVTYDLARQMDGAVEISCSQFGREIVRHMSGRSE